MNRLEEVVARVEMEEKNGNLHGLTEDAAFKKLSNAIYSKTEKPFSREEVLFAKEYIRKDKKHERGALWLGLLESGYKDNETIILAQKMIDHCNQYHGYGYAMSYLCGILTNQELAPLTEKYLNHDNHVVRLKWAEELVVSGRDVARGLREFLFNYGHFDRCDITERFFDYVKEFGTKDLAKELRKKACLCMIKYMKTWDIWDKWQAHSCLVLAKSCGIGGGYWAMRCEGYKKKMPQEKNPTISRIHQIYKMALDKIKKKKGQDGSTQRSPNQTEEQEKQINVSDPKSLS
jgi:hypothetical protein